MKNFSKNLVLATLTIGAMSITPINISSANAEDPLVIGTGDNSVITGIVDSVYGDTLYIIFNDTKIEVDADDLSLDDNLESYFPVGTKVTVTGKMEDSDEIDARKIIRLEDAQPTINLNNTN